MSILVTPQTTRRPVQGITGSFGAKHTKLSLDYGFLRSWRASRREKGGHAF